MDAAPLEVLPRSLPVFVAQSTVDWVRPPRVEPEPVAGTPWADAPAFWPVPVTRSSRWVATSVQASRPTSEPTEALELGTVARRATSWYPYLQPARYCSFAKCTASLRAPPLHFWAAPRCSGQAPVSSCTAATTTATTAMPSVRTPSTASRCKKPCGGGGALTLRRHQPPIRTSCACRRCYLAPPLTKHAPLSNAQLGTRGRATAAAVSRPQRRRGTPSKTSGWRLRHSRQR